MFIWWETRVEEPILPLQLFRSSVFRVANAMGFTIGMAMFGAIVFIPLYLQLVYGASPTSSGLRLLPLMAGLLVAAVASGRAISRIGRYKAFPIAGTAMLVCGMYLLSRLGVGTAPWLASLHAGRRGRDRPRHAGARPGRPERRPAAGDRSCHVDRDLLPLGRRLLRRGDLRDDLRLAPLQPAVASADGDHGASRRRRAPQPEQAKHLPPAVHADFLQAFSHSLHGVFLWGMAISAIPFALSWLLKEVPLRTTVGPSAEAAVEAPAGGTPDERGLTTAARPSLEAD